MKDIRILIYSHNEIKMLPLKKKWCDYHGLRMIYFDNESTDGSREWAIKENVFEGDIKTNGEFDIIRTMSILENYRINNKYDYTIISGVDMFMGGLGKITLSEYINQIDSKGYDGLMCSYIMLCRSDETSTLDFRHYSRGLYYQDRMILIGKSDRKLSADSINIKNPIQNTDIWWFNLGNTKTVKERKATYNRRKKAWNRGLKKGYGNHYQDLANYNFTIPNLVTKNIYELGAKKPLFELCELIDKIK